MKSIKVIRNSYEFLEKDMRNMEKKMNHTVLSKECYSVVRVDGHGFSKYVKVFDRPHDTRIAAAMQRTAVDLLKFFGGVTAYTFSDEISLLLAPTNDIVFGGRVTKLSSVAAGLASARFNVHLGSFALSEQQQSRVGEAFFDGRAFSLSDSRVDVLRYFHFRLLDCIRNSQT